FVNDSPLAEEYIECEITEDYGPIIIEEGWLFVLGDNRHPGASMDSRSFGPIKLSSILGRADFVVLPSPHKVD
ncbi:MAG TPA: signal peptidase I, partial [Firmicutes bacterium]|nr:signal peptidase I [Bacillota bacterium]